MLDKETLHRLYVLERKTGPEIAELVGVRSQQTIYNWLSKYGIPRRDIREAQRAVVPTKETLEQLYCVQKLSIDTIAHRLSSSESSISRFLDDYGIAKRPKWNKFAGWNAGKNLPESQKQYLSEIAKARIGEKSPRYGAKLSATTRAQIADSLKGRFRGPENPQWRGGHRYERAQWAARYEYKDWRAAVFQRDNYTCKMCGKVSNGDIQAHHIHPWRDFPELRFDVENGITLCNSCHKSLKGNEIEQANQFITILLASQ